MLDAEEQKGLLAFNFNFLTLPHRFLPHFHGYVMIFLCISKGVLTNISTAAI